MPKNYKNPLSLYIHIPWCIAKCPYCDFNSHAVNNDHLPEKKYLAALLIDLQLEAERVGQRELYSVFIGGGTPSLFSADAIAQLLQAIKQHFNVTTDIEITLEANPGTFEYAKFKDFAQAGINRLSIGVQSFSAKYLKALGRVHDDKQAKKAIEIAHTAGFKSFNVDLMFGLPQQTLAQALQDLEQAITIQAPHVSWYQLTLEPNTLFARKPPTLPDDDTLWDMQTAGQRLLAKTGFTQYEVSAYAQTGQQCRHNLNYWQFGDYAAIGAGAHAKITNPHTGVVQRYHKYRSPEAYMRARVNFLPRHSRASTNESKIKSQLDSPIKSANDNKRYKIDEIKKQNPFTSGEETIPPENLPFEFMLNALRLYQTIPLSLFTARTGLSASILQPKLNKLVSKGLARIQAEELHITHLGRRFLNDMVEMFLP